MPASADPVSLCPRCGRPTGPLFPGSGLCPACAAGALLEQTPGGPAGALSRSAGGAPSQIGPYRIVELLGAGGMGAVYLAQHRQLGRMVAIKVIPLHGSGAALRFQREAQTIAGLRHPRIITVHDAGHDDHHCYFAMDYVEGGDLARRLLVRPYAPRAAAQLLHQVAGAVAYSHAQGVLHRDLKPSNILLDGDDPRVADFGLAASLEAGGDLTLHSAVLGTPHYLAPEALLRGSAAQSPAGDVYALGVILYEMLCGRRPYRAATPAELLQVITTTEPLAPRLFGPTIPRDLDTICLKAFAPEPARRYATAAALAEDLRRFLAGEPIAARPLSPAGRLWRWSRRRPALAALWGLTFLLAAGSTTAAWQINRERRRVEAEAGKSRALVDFLGQDLLDQASPNGEPDRNLPLRTLLDRAVARLPGRFPDQPLVEATVRVTLASNYHSLGEFATEEKLLRPALALRRHFLGADARPTLEVVVGLSECLGELGRRDEALRLLAPAAATLRRTLGPDRRETFHAINTLAATLHQLGREPEAATLLVKNLLEARRTLGPAAEESRNALSLLSSVRWAQHRFAEAETLNRAALAIFEHERGPEHAETQIVRSNLATIYTSTRRFAEAETIHRQLLASHRRRLGPDHPETLRSLSNLSTVCGSEGKLTESLALAEELVAARRRILGPAHPDTLLAQNGLAVALGRNGRLAEGIDLIRDTAATATGTVGADNFATQNYRRTYAGMLLSAHRSAEALPICRAVLDSARRTGGPDDPQTAVAAEMLATALAAAGFVAESEPLWREVVASFHRTEPTGWRLAFANGQWGTTLARLNRPDEAEPLLREACRALAGREAELPPRCRPAPAAFAKQLALVAAARGRSAAPAAGADVPPPAAPAKP